MKAVLTCLLLLVLTYIGHANAMMYQRVIKISDNKIIRTWTDKKPRCLQVINDCKSILGKEEQQCIQESKQQKISEKCL